MIERLLVRGGQPCGIAFTVLGPRAVALTAIWETDRNRLLFYDSHGRRFRMVQLTASTETVLSGGFHRGDRATASGSRLAGEPSRGSDAIRAGDFRRADLTRGAE
jgi:hypothetical protein